MKVEGSGYGEIRGEKNSEEKYLERMRKDLGNCRLVGGGCSERLDQKALHYSERERLEIGLFVFASLVSFSSMWTRLEFIFLSAFC